MTLPSIDLRLADRLKDREFRREWFHAQLEADVPELFRDMREEREMTQSDLARESGMKQSAISRFESSRDAKWKFETLTKLADALDVRLVISIERAEDVIARHLREESGNSNPQKSVLEADPIKHDFNGEEFGILGGDGWRRRNDQKNKRDLTDRERGDRGISRG